jgi:hypothetical protein
MVPASTGPRSTHDHYPSPVSSFRRLWCGNCINGSNLHLQQELEARAQSWRQRVELSKWLREAAKDAVGRERAQLTANSVAEIFSCLSGGQIRDACQVQGRVIVPYFVDGY